MCARPNGSHTAAARGEKFAVVAERQAIIRRFRMKGVNELKIVEVMICRWPVGRAEGSRGGDRDRSWDGGRGKTLRSAARPDATEHALNNLRLFPPPDL